MSFEVLSLLALLLTGPSGLHALGVGFMPPVPVHNGPLRLSGDQLQQPACPQPINMGYEREDALSSMLVNMFNPGRNVASNGLQRINRPDRPMLLRSQSLETVKKLSIDDRYSDILLRAFQSGSLLHSARVPSGGYEQAKAGREWVTSAGMGSAAAADITIAVSLCYYLMKSRTGFKRSVTPLGSNVHSTESAERPFQLNRTDSLISTLMIYSLTTGLVTRLNSRDSLREKASPNVDNTFFQLTPFRAVPDGNPWNSEPPSPTADRQMLAVGVQIQTVSKTDYGSIVSPVF
ncbi:hypothetical protein CVT26_007127 [Gymnopilus dilepis]|uniref:DUF6534 domain-containing protein n=1 Tax=Gymnopilus dilepis TaxID=231916 RepID=A0A409W1B3_9AGAR|nr:hypothetical protein CVT26_007127 [Gymnopilus dilepis]